MRIPCPHCGDRSHAEFLYLGDATPTRPATSDGVGHDQALFADYVYLRANPAGWHREWWQHTGGCRAWLAVERNAATHAIRSVVTAAALGAGRGEVGR